jgi:hypothetical protein
MMQAKSVVPAILGVLVVSSLSAQVQPPPAPWRGAGPTPCVGSDGGIFQCPPRPATIAIKAGRLFDSRTGRLVANQVLVVEGERIRAVGSPSQVAVPRGAQVIDLSRATVLPGLIDAHTHIFNVPSPGLSREMATLIAVHNVQADLRAGFTALRDMGSTATAMPMSICGTRLTRGDSRDRGCRCPGEVSCGPPEPIG